MNDDSIRTFHSLLPPGSRYALLIAPPYGRKHLLKDFGFEVEKWISQLLKAIEPEFKFIPTPTNIYILEDERDLKLNLPSNVRYITDLQSISESSIALLTPFTNETILSYLSEQIHQADSTTVRLQYFAPNAIEVYSDVTDYLGSASSLTKVFHPYVKRSNPKTLTRKQLTKYILEEGILKQIEKSDDRRVSLHVGSVRFFQHLIKDLEDNKLVSRYSIDFDPETFEAVPAPKTKYVVLENLVRYRKEEYWPHVNQALQQFTSDQYLISAELFKSDKLRDRLEFIEINLLGMLKESPMHSASALLSLPHENKKVYAYPRALVTNNGLRNLLPNVFIYDMAQLDNDLIWKYGYERFYMYPDFWYDCNFKGPYPADVDVQADIEEYRNKIATNETARLLFEQSLENVDENIAAALRGLYDPDYEGTATEITYSDMMDIREAALKAKKESSLSSTQQSEAESDSPHGSQLDETHQNVSNEFEVLRNKVKHEIADRVRRGKLGKRQYLHVAWQYRMRHPATSRAQCLEDFKKLVGQPIVGWKDETAARTFKRYYSEKALGYVPSEHKDHGYTPTQDLEFILDYVKKEWPDPGEDGA